MIVNPLMEKLQTMSRALQLNIPDTRRLLHDASREIYRLEEIIQDLEGENADLEMSSNRS